MYISNNLGQNKAKLRWLNHTSIRFPSPLHSFPCRASGARGAGRVMAKPPCQGNRPWDRPQGRRSAGYPAEICRKWNDEDENWEKLRKIKEEI